MADSSFDIVSKVDRQEVDNALNQAAKELATRFDFRGTDTKIAWKGDEAVELTSSTEECQGRRRRLQGEADPPRHLAEGLRGRRTAGLG